MVEVEVANESALDTSARGSRDPPPPIPTLDTLEPGVRWWSDLIGMTNPLEEEEGEQRIINADTFRTIVANLQGQQREERCRNIGSLLSFFGLFLAEMMRAVWEAENGDVQVLLQISVAARGSAGGHGQGGDGGHDDVLSLMQRMSGRADQGFHEAIRQIQEKMEGMSKAGAARIARCMGHLLHDHGQRKDVTRPQGAAARFDIIGALMAAFEDNQLVTHDETDPWCIDIWHNTLLRYLQVGSDEGESSEAGPCHEAAGVGDDEDPSQGIRVRPARSSDWRPATREEAREIVHHEEELRREALEQERRDRDAFSRYEAGRAREWEDWAIRSEMDAPSVSQKRVRLTLVIGSASGKHVAEGTIEGVMPAAELPMIGGRPAAAQCRGTRARSK